MAVALRQSDHARNRHAGRDGGAGHADESNAPFNGSNTDLASALSAALGREITAKGMKQMMNRWRFQMEALGVYFESRRSNGQKYIRVKYVSPQPTDMNSARPPERNLIRNGRSATKTALNFTARTEVFPKAVYRNHAGGNTVSTQSSRTLPGVTLTTISVTCSGVKLIMFPELFRKTLDFEPDWEYDCLGKILFPSTLNRFDCTRR